MNSNIATIEPTQLVSQFEASMVNSEDLSLLNELSQELSENWRKKQVYRSETEMRVSVLNDANFPTIASKYWQCVREQDGMLGSLMGTSFEYRRNNVKLKRLQRRLDAATDELDIEELTIDIEQCQYNAKSLEQDAHDRIRELSLWSQLKGELNDESFDTEEVNNHQLDSIIRQLIARAAALGNESDPNEVLNVVGPLRSSLVEKAKTHPQFLLPDEVEMLRDFAEGDPSLLEALPDGLPQEAI